MERQDFTVPLSGDNNSGAASAAPGSGKKKNRNRNRNRSANSKSRSRARDGSNDTTFPSNKRGDRSLHNNKSWSPTRQRNQDSKSKFSAWGGDRSSKSQSPSRSQCKIKNNRRRNHHQHQNVGPPADMTVICNRSDLWDSAAHFQPDDTHANHHQVSDCSVRPYHFAPDLPKNHSVPSPSADPASCSVTVARVPHHFEEANIPIMPEGQGYCDVVDTSIPNPHGPEVVHDKYWAQRRRLFSRFDQGVQLDAQGWYSVTPEIIADHVANRVAELATTQIIPNQSSEGIVILDAFCGCGGNSIAFGKIPSNIISKVVCVDTDRTKLLRAAHNASLYGIPKDKLVFVECNSIFILQHCFKDGQFILDQPRAQLPPYMPAPVMPILHAGYQVGGLDLLPRRIDAVFMDPPWGGVDYEVLGKNGYDLQKNMKIQVGPIEPVPVVVEDDYKADGDGCDDFFDMFAGPAAKPKPKMSQNARKANFNKQVEGCHVIDGMELLRVAAAAVSARLIVYDLPRNTNKATLGKCALGAGYRGNIKLEEHYLNGRLKTVTAYMGADYSDLINSFHEPAMSTGSMSGDESLG